MVESGALISVALRNGIPPALLQAALYRNVPEAVYANLPAAKGNDQLTAELVARTLAQAHQTNGTWDRALSYYYSGNPDSGANPQDPTSGLVASTIAQGAMNPTLGLDHVTGATAVNAVRLSATLRSFAESMRPFAQSGGIISGQSVDYFASHVQSLVQRLQQVEQQQNQPVGAQGAPGGAPGGGGMGDQLPTPAPTPGDPGPGEALPFDKQYDQVNQPFGPSDSPLEGGYTYQSHYYPRFHTGVDYAVRDKSPLYAAKPGWVEFNTNWGAGPQGAGHAVILHADDGSTILYGHVSGEIANGARVQAGMQIATSGGGVGDPGRGDSDGPHLHLEYKDANGQLLNADPWIQKIAQDPRPHPYATTPAPGLPEGTIPAGTDQNAMKSGAGQPGQAQKDDKGPSPQEVGQFAKDAQAAGIHDPQQIVDAIPILGPMMRRYMGKDPTLADVTRHGAIPDPKVITASLLSEPHPSNPLMTVAEYEQTMAKASLASGMHQARLPYSAEVHRLWAANASNKELNDYYSQAHQQATVDRPQQNQQQQGQPPPGQPGDSQNGNVVQLPQQRSGRGSQVQ